MIDSIFLFCLWIIKFDSSECFATSWNIEFIFLLLMGCLLSLLILFEVPENFEYPDYHELLMLSKRFIPLVVTQ